MVRELPVRFFQLGARKDLRFQRLPTLFLFFFFPTQIAYGLGTFQKHCTRLLSVLPSRNSTGTHTPPFLEALKSEKRPTLKLLSWDQSTLKPQVDIDGIKKDMLDGKFKYDALEARIGGNFFEGVYYIREGHGRLAAALEIAQETGNWLPFNLLIYYGKWDEVATRPSRVYPLAVRRRPGVNWRPFLDPFRP